MAFIILLQVRKECMSKNRHKMYVILQTINDKNLDNNSHVFTIFPCNIKMYNCHRQEAFARSHSLSTMTFVTPTWNKYDLLQWTGLSVSKCFLFWYLVLCATQVTGFLSCIVCSHHLFLQMFECSISTSSTPIKYFLSIV